MATGTKQLRLALALATLPTIAYVLHDLVFQLPDNAHEASLGFFITVAGLLCVWATSGYTIARGVSSTASRIIAGSVVGMASVGMLWLTSMVLNALFVDRMSYEPDRIRAFQQSGYATMSDFLRHQGWGPAPLLMFVAAIVGAIAAASQKRGRIRAA